MLYLLYGNSFHLIDEKIKKIVKDSTNIVTMDLNLNTMEEVLTEATYISMFHEEKYLIVKNATIFTSKKAKDSDIELLLQYMENPVSLTHIIFTCYEHVDARKKVTKVFKEKYKMLDVELAKYDDLVDKIRDYVHQNSFKIETDAIEYLINACLNHYDLIYNELNKAFIYYNDPTMIKLEDVKKITARSLCDNNFRFVEAVIKKDFNLSNSILKDLYTIKVDPIALLILLAREFRLMLTTKLLMSNGYKKSEICKNLSLQDWQVDKLLKESSLYYEDEIKSYLKELAEIDYKVKSGTMDKFIALKMFLVSM